MRILYQSLVLILAFAFVFLWQMSPLSGYTVQTLGFFVFLFLITSARKKGFNPTAAIGNNSVWSIFFVTAIILLLIFGTGDINSTLFFLLYFLGFGVAFVFEPPVVFIFMLGTIAVFIPEVIRDDVTGNMIKVASIILITPLAYFFGRAYKKEEEQELKLSQTVEQETLTADAIYDDVKEVLDKEKQNLPAEDAAKLEDALKQTEELRKE